MLAGRVPTPAALGPSGDPRDARTVHGGSHEPVPQSDGTAPILGSVPSDSRASRKFRVAPVTPGNRTLLKVAGRSLCSLPVGGLEPESAS